MFLHHCSLWANVWPVVTALGKDLINILAVLEICVHCLNYLDSSILEFFSGEWEASEWPQVYTQYCDESWICFSCK